MNIANKNDERIVKEVLENLNLKYECHKYFNDGVSSRVLLLNNKYLIKQNTALALEAEVEFLKLNTGDMIQKIIYVDPEYKYVVYGFMEGNTMKDVKDVDDTIEKLLNIVNSYKKYDKKGYGYYDELVDTWEEFLLSEIEESSKNIKEYIPNNELAVDCVTLLRKYPFEKKIIHGDFGTHNFIENNSKLTGIIDPQSVLGDPLYDILFAFVSNVDILQEITLERLDYLLNEDKEKIYAMLVIVLYSRISRCLKYHKEDIDIYMNYWRYLENKKSNYLY